MKLFFIPIVLVSWSSLTAQTGHFEVVSGPMKIRIVNDTIPPVVTLNPFRAIEKGFKVRQRDTVISLSGIVSDNEAGSSLEINRTPVPLTQDGKFSARVHLWPGENRIGVHAFDRKRNHTDTTVVVYQDARADTNPPAITITEPFKGRGFRLFKKAPTLRVSGTVASATPLWAVFVNGSRIDSLQDGLFRCDLPTDSLRAIYVKAVDTCGNVSLDSIILPPHAFSVEADAGDITQTGKFFALLIAVQDYKAPAIHNLVTPIRDTGRLESVLRTQYGFEKENVVFLKDPSRDKILEAFERMKNTVGEEDNFLVFYAGHGTEDKEAGQGYWWPSDADPVNHSRWISNADLRDQIKRIKSRHTLLIADACFSGSVFRVSRGSLDNADIPTLEAFKTRSRTALTSGEADVPDESVFTQCLIQNLGECTNRHLRARDLFYLLHDDVMSNSPNRQSVAYGAIQEAGDAGTGDFVFVKRSAVNRNSGQ